MTETLVSKPVVDYEQEPPNYGVPDREAMLRDLLSVDYDQAVQEGLIDMFQVDAATGNDGLLHTLTGGVVTTTHGGIVPEGFHHEPSAKAVWPHVTNGSGSKPVTYVDRSHLESANSSERAKYREFPFEPYQGQVVIGGLKKYSVHKNAETGEAKLAPAKNTMFPKEYDEYMVLRSVKEAYDNRDRENEFTSKDVDGHDVIVAQGDSIMMDGKSKMPIRLVLDAQTGKIRTAIPITKRKPGIMKLTSEQAEALIFGDLLKKDEK